MELHVQEPCVETLASSGSYYRSKPREGLTTHYRVAIVCLNDVFEFEMSQTPDQQAFD